MSTRIVFDREFAHAIRIRGLTIGELAKRARLSQAPPSAAVHGKPLNSRRWTLLRSKKEQEHSRQYIRAYKEMPDTREEIVRAHHAASVILTEEPCIPFIQG